MSSLSKVSKTLYIVPTPIGNLQDITYRALFVLRQVHYIIAESSKRIRALLNFFSIKTAFYIMNRYNESLKIPILISKLQQGYNIALVSDAGTPIINDPGYLLVKLCHEKKIKVVPLPGPCAAITALCGSGLPSNRFCFEGFFPSKRNLRIKRLKELSEESRTLVFYDVKHRITESLKDIISVFGKMRYVVLVRELSKIWESIYGATAGQLLFWVQQDKTRIQGEMVLVISGYNNGGGDIVEESYVGLSPNIIYTMNLLISELSISAKKAAVLVGKIYNVKKNKLYRNYLNNQSKLIY